MSKECHCRCLEDTDGLFKSYFVLLKMTRDLRNEIPNLDSREERVKAYKEYFRKLKALRELEVQVEDGLKILSWL